MSDYIKREDVLELARKGFIISNGNFKSVVQFIFEIPAADVIPGVHGHGDLIDRDALIADLKRQCEEVFKTDAVSPDDFWITRNQAYNERLWTTWCESLFDYLKAAPTIIPADNSTHSNTSNTLNALGKEGE